ncbi:MAG TPA: helical backbone metal receptor, partial [Elusimicrobiota bacterium]|nr:helical backbone metal receptor [Elusimicrobiota bacterium]
MRFIRAIAVFLVAAPLWAGARERRLVSLLPSHSEIVTALGTRTSLVAVSDSEHPGDFPGLPRAGALEPRWEVLMALRPDLILADSSHERFAADFQRHRLPVLFLPATHAKSIEDVFDLIRKVGDAIDRAPEATALIFKLKERLARLDARPRPARRPRVYFEIWPRPLQSVGTASF